MKKKINTTTEQDCYSTFKKQNNTKSNGSTIEKILYDNFSTSNINDPLDCFNINNRRYLGAKTKLLDFIQSSVNKHIGNYESFADMFSGTGVVAEYFNKKEKKIITNDMLYSNYLIHYAFLSNDKFDKIVIKELLNYFNNILPIDNYFSDTFGDKYFSHNVAKKIGTIREEINNLSGSITKREKYILITSLIYAIDKIANTCGHYDAFRQGKKMEENFTLKTLSIYHDNNQNNIILNSDANKAIEDIGNVDILYLDPPYNSRQYISAYHLIENLAKWEKPTVAGVASKMLDRKKYNSEYCTKRAISSLEDLINKASAKYIILSYSNMAKQGNDRSNARMDDNNIKDILSNKGKLSIESIQHKPFSTGKTNLQTHGERLFICQTK